MKYINVRQLLNNYKESTSELPVTVTKSGIPIFKIISVEDSEPAKKTSKNLANSSMAHDEGALMEEIRAENVKKPPVSLKQTEGPRGFERRCSIGLCNNLAVAMRDGYWYCKEHL